MTQAPSNDLDIPAPIAVFIDAVNRHDEQGFLDTLGDDVTVIADWRSTHANGLSRFTFLLDGERITSMTIREG